MPTQDKQAPGLIDFKDVDVLTFDCYGTLVDWETGILNAIGRVLAAHGARLPDHEIISLYGKLEMKAEAGEYKRYREILGEVMLGFAARINLPLTGVEIASLAESLADWKPFPDTVAALKRLKSRYKLVILSNVDDDLFAGTARQLGIRFDDVITAQQVGSYKPSLRNFETALKRVTSKKESIVHVAQSLYHDIAPARQLNIKSVWVTRRSGRKGIGNAHRQAVRPNLEVPDLKTLADLAL